MPKLSVSLFGTFRAELDGRLLTGFESNKVRALLAYLIMHANRPIDRDELIGVLWPERPEQSARGNLSQSLANLRRTIGEEAATMITARRDTVQFNLSDTSRLDVAEFSAVLDTCQRHIHRALASCRSCAARLQAAVDLYRGDFLAQFFLSGSEPFEEWVLAHRERLQRGMLDALSALADYHDRRADYDRARRYALHQLELDPWREEAYRQAMHALALGGQRSAALVQYHLCRRRLASELGTDPAPETTALCQQIKAGVLKPTVPKFDLPVLATPLIGRQAELAHIAELLEHPACRLITLLGPGGIGKTCLALQAAYQHVGAFVDGVSFVSLAELTSSEFVAPAIANAIHCPLTGRNAPEAELIAYLADRQMLLVLDNFDHLLSSVDILARLLEHAREVVVIVTSRARLYLSQEWTIDVAGLPFPDSDRPTQPDSYDAVRLFTHVARRVVSDYVLTDKDWPAVVRICQLVEGLPLALELAASWLRTLNGHEIAREIEQSLDLLRAAPVAWPDRYLSVQATFDYSWQLLSAAEQCACRRLAVFRGAFEREAAEKVGELSLAVLSALINKSMLRRTADGRYEMHGLLRQYAGRQLAAADEAEQTHLRHFTYFLTLAETAKSKLRAAEQDYWLNRLEMVRDDLRAALEWSWQATVADELRLRLVESLAEFWLVRGYFSEGRAWLDKALTRLNGSVPAHLCAQVLDRAGYLAYLQGDYTVATKLFESSLVIRQGSGDQQELAKTWRGLGIVAHAQGRYDTARRYYEESLTLCRATNDRWGLATTLSNLGVIAYDQLNYDAAAVIYEECLAMRHELSDHGGVAYLLNALGMVAWSIGNYVHMKTLNQESLSIRRHIGDKWGIAYSLDSLGLAAWCEGDYAQACACFEESLVLFRELNNRSGLVNSLERFARLAVSSGQVEQAAQLFGAAEALRETIQARLSPAECADRDHQIDLVRARVIDESTFTQYWAQGGAMSLECAVDYALNITAESSSKHILPEEPWGTAVLASA